MVCIEVLCGVWVQSLSEWVWGCAHVSDRGFSRMPFLYYNSVKISGWVDQVGSFVGCLRWIYWLIGCGGSVVSYMK